MARNQIEISATPEDVFDVLRDPFTYSEWVVGTKEIVEADPSWPARDSWLSFRVGAGAFTLEGTTRVVAIDEPRRLRLESTRFPAGALHIGIEVTDLGDGNSCVTIDETFSLGSAVGAGLDAMLHVRNFEALNRLKALVEGGMDRYSMTPLSIDTHWLDDEPYSEIVRNADSCFLGIETKGGPHVLPVAYGYSFGRLWILAERSSLKTRIADRRPNVGVLIRVGERSLVLRGCAEVLDVTHPWASGIQLTERLLAGPAFAGYLKKNVSRLIGAASEGFGSVMDLNPLARVALVVSPESLSLVEDGRIVDRRGGSVLDDGGRGRSVADARGEELDLGPVPDDIAELADEERAEAALGWMTETGPVVLPARWHPQRSLASTPAALLDGVTESPVALCLENEGGGIADLKGLVVRGMGTVTGSGDHAAISIDQDKTTFWSGSEIRTIS